MMCLFITVVSMYQFFNDIIFYGKGEGLSSPLGAEKIIGFSIFGLFLSSRNWI